MVLLNLLQVLRCLSELISPAEASSVSCGTNDREPLLTANHITAWVSVFSILIANRHMYVREQGSNVAQHASFFIIVKLQITDAFEYK